MLKLIIKNHPVKQNIKNQKSKNSPSSMQSPKPRKPSLYDQNGFRTDEFSLRLIKSMTDHNQLEMQLDKWKSLIPRIKELKENNERALIYYVRKGIPDSLRKEVWPKLIMQPIKPYEFYLHKQQCKQIQLDLDRTFPDNKIIKNLTAKMRSVLNAIAYAIPELGYCQGMNFITAIILLKLQEQQAFNMMHHIFHWQKHEDLLKNLDEIHRKMFVLQKLIKKFYPKLHDRLKQWNIDCLFFASPWFITLFCNSLPCAYVLRILQMYLLEGEKILYRVALQILKIKKTKLKKLTQFQHIMEELKNFQDLTTTEQQINKFVTEMFKIDLSRKDIESYDKEYQLKLKKQSPKKSPNKK